MKKIIIILLIALMISASLFAFDNGQKVWSVDSSIYKSLESLYIMSGKAMPSSSGPWSENELSMMLRAIDRNSLPESGKALWDNVKRKITATPKSVKEDTLGLSFGLEVNPEFYAHTNSDSFIDYTDWFHSYSTRRSKFLNFKLETWASDMFYGYFELSLGNNIGYNVGEGRNGLYKNTFNSNIPLVNSFLFSMPKDEKGKDHLFADFDWTFPYKSLASAGGKHWNLIAGRDKLSWGSGETGNLMLSSTFPRHTMVKFTTFYNSFKYSLVGTMYPSSKAKESQYKSLDGFKSLIVHRLEFRLFNGKLGIAANEACMFFSTPDQKFTLAQINPFGFMHNEYIAYNANSLLVFEADYTPIKGINIYGQYAVDEFSGPGEGRTNPAAFGYLAGAKAAYALGDGIITGGIEYVRTDPFLFIRGLHYNNDEERKGYGFDAIFRTISSDRIICENMFVTYPYGNDVVVLDGRINYEVPGKWNAGLEVMYLQNGVMGIDSNWGQFKGEYESAPTPVTPTESNPFGTETGKVEKKTVISLTGAYNLLDNLTFDAKCDYLMIRNIGNQAGVNGSDLQITFGMSYSL